MDTNVFDRILMRACECGFADAAVVEVKDLVVVPFYRSFCEENACGNFGANYSCPPYCGTVKEQEEKIRRYEHALVLKTQREVDDAMDSTEVRPLKKDHTHRSAKLFREFRKEGILPEGGLSMMAGPCDLCAVCGMREGKPCPFPEDRASCLSAYSVDVTKLAAAAGMEIRWTPDQVSFFSLYLF